MIENNKDFFDKLEKLITKLERDKLIDFAEQLRYSTTISTVPGEIFGSLKLDLNRILESSKEKYHLDVLELMNYLKEIL